MLHILASLLGYLNGLAHLVADIHAVVLRVCNHTGKLGRVVCNLIDGNGQLIHRHIQFAHGLGLDICRRLHLSGHTVARIRLRSQFSGNVSHGRNHLLHGCDKALHAAAHKRNLIIAAALDRYGKVAVRALMTFVSFRTGAITTCVVRSITTHRIRMEITLIRIIRFLRFARSASTVLVGI